MALYMIQRTYTAEAWAVMANRSESRAPQIDQDDQVVQR